MRKIHFAYSLTLLLLLLMLIVGTVNTLDMIQRYGWIYEEITIINGVSTVQTVNNAAGYFASGMFLWLILIITYSYKIVLDSKDEE